MLEKDLFIPIKDYLENQGFLVKAEVLNTDITAIKDNLVIIVEMKIKFNVKLIYQGCIRQKITDNVYLAIPKPTTKIMNSKSFKEKLFLLKRLHLGLIFVDVLNDEVVVYLDPSVNNVRTVKKKRTKLLKEFNNRVTSYNYGGVTKTKIITAYFERTLLIAYYLSNSPLMVKEIKQLTSDEKCAAILQKNYYKWFNRISRGLYELSDNGKNDIIKYNDILQEIINSEKNISKQFII